MWEKEVEKEHPFTEYSDQLQALGEKKLIWLYKNLLHLKREGILSATLLGRCS